MLPTFHSHPAHILLTSCSLILLYNRNQDDNRLKLDWVTDQLEIHGTALRASSRALEQLLNRMEALAAHQALGEGTPGAGSEASSVSVAVGGAGGGGGAGAGQFQRAGTLARVARAFGGGGHNR
jgi:hypothetical protein